MNTSILEYNGYNTLTGIITARNLRNILGTCDDDILNVACEEEEVEELSTNIITSLCKAHNVKRFFRSVMSFEKIKKVLSSFNFQYIEAKEEEESYIFLQEKTGYHIYLYPRTWYPHPGHIVILNMHIM